MTAESTVALRAHPVHTQRESSLMGGPASPPPAEKMEGEIPIHDLRPMLELWAFPSCLSPPPTVATADWTAVTRGLKRPQRGTAEETAVSVEMNTINTRRVNPPPTPGFSILWHHTQMKQDTKSHEHINSSNHSFIHSFNCRHQWSQCLRSETLLGGERYQKEAEEP